MPGPLNHLLFNASLVRQRFLPVETPVTIIPDSEEVSTTPPTAEIATEQSAVLHNERKVRVDLMIQQKCNMCSCLGDGCPWSVFLGNTK